MSESSMQKYPDRRKDDKRIEELCSIVHEVKEKVERMEPIVAKVSENEPTLTRAAELITSIEGFFKAIYIISLPFSWTITKIARGAKILLPIFLFIIAGATVVESYWTRIIKWIVGLFR